ncbi:hypothetical protein KV541_01490 [Halobacterium salinarum]|nr:hypothetical protein [Halobacterium salinarum]MCF2166837.1 hypothetical protein [Halobacterium salinarum]
MSDKDIVVNVGEEDGVVAEMEFIVYEVGEVIEDPDTGEALGNVEHVKARVVPKHIQEKMTVMTSGETETKSKGLYGLTESSGTKTVKKSIARTDEKSFDDDVKVDDLVREDVSE